MQSDAAVEAAAARTMLQALHARCCRATPKKGGHLYAGRSDPKTDSDCSYRSTQHWCEKGGMAACTWAPVPGCQ
jgi:hypothetical protein